LPNQGKIVSGKKGHTVIDGPFVESKEAIGGYFLLHVSNEREAIEIAKHCPGLEHGVQVEVRPVVEFCPSGELATQAAEQLPVELASDKLTTEPKWRSLEGPSVKRPPPSREPRHGRLYKFANFPCNEIISAAATIVG